MSCGQIPQDINWISVVVLAALGIWACGIILSAPRRTWHHMDIEQIAGQRIAGATKVEQHEEQQQDQQQYQPQQEEGGNVASTSHPADLLDNPGERFCC